MASTPLIPAGAEEPAHGCGLYLSELPQAMAVGGTAKRLLQQTQQRLGSRGSAVALQ